MSAAERAKIPDYNDVAGANLSRGTDPVSPAAADRSADVSVPSEGPDSSAYETKAAGMRTEGCNFGPSVSSVAQVAAATQVDDGY